MGLSARLFYDANSLETLAGRISLTPEQLEDARQKKDKLLELIKPELSSSLDVPVRHWLQGSYKNHTLIRPVRKGEEFDIDVGIYLMCNAEEQGLGALDSKLLNREVLEWFVSNRPEAKLEESKTNCERLSYPSSFHIDIPLYFYDDESGCCKLATSNDEWVESDPKAFQDWFNKSVSSLSKTELGQLRRVIKYLKVWTLLKSSSDKICIPSIAITVLVVENFKSYEDDDDSFIETTMSAMGFLVGNRLLMNPAGDGDLFGFDDAEYEVIQGKAQALLNACKFICNSTDSFQQYVLWGATFEHFFPPFIERKEEVSQNTNLPALTTPPRVRVRHLDKKKVIRSNSVTDEIYACRDEELYFSIENKADYSEFAEVHWIVKNQDSEAKRVNDMGHTSLMKVANERYEGCSYSGTHYMECLVLEGNNIKGISAVKVRISGFSRPLRNPPRKKHYRGR